MDQIVYCDDLCLGSCQARMLLPALIAFTMSRSTPPFDSSRQAPVKIIIVGAGIAGLTLAKALESIPSVHYTVLEARDELAPQEGAGIALAPGGSRILDQLGVYASLEAQMAPVSSSGLYDEKGRMLLPVRSDAAQLVGSRMGYPFGLVERREVVSALLSQISRKDCIKTRKTVLRVEHSRNQSEPITVVCTDGSKFHGDLVVGADGVRSKVRSEMWTAVEQGICGNFDVRRERAGKGYRSILTCTMSNVLNSTNGRVSVSFRHVLRHRRVRTRMQ